jgi:hypothetical protein
MLILILILILVFRWRLRLPPLRLQPVRQPRVWPYRHLFGAGGLGGVHNP